MALPDGIPERTLGWGILDWCSKWLVNPDSRGGDKGGQWIFKPDQARFILWFYAVDEEGNWIYRRAYRERAKGTGKSPMVAAIACAEFLGPAQFSHFDRRGRPVGKAREEAVIWLSAISQDGCRHTYRYIMGMLQGKAEREFGLDIGMTRILVRGRANDHIIETITASFRSHEGPQPNFAICEETQNWTPAERGPDLFEVIRRGLFKTDGRLIEVTNAPVPGENTVAEETHKFQQQIEEGEATDDGLLFDTFSLIVKDLGDKEEVMAALKIMYANAPWIRLERAWEEIQDPQTREVNARRFFFNEMVSPTSMWIDVDTWDLAKRKIKLRRTDKISLGFRVKKNCCAIVATRLDDLSVYLLNIWEKPQDSDRFWEVPYAKIDLRMRSLMDKYNVVNVTASPENFQDIVGRWFIDYEDVVDVKELWVSRSRQKMADAVELFETAVRDQRLIHDGNEDLARHIANCFVEEVTQGVIIRQVTEGSPRYIVAAEAAVLSVYGALEAIENGALRETASGVLYSY